jgi:hypothetical protein
VRAGKLISALVATSALAVVPSVTGATTAHAAGGDIICRGGNVEASFGPGITWQTKTVQATFSIDLGQCTSLSDTAITGGTAVGQATMNGECPNGGQGNGTATITWNNQKTSKVSFTFVVNQNQFGMSGVHVISGEFQGDTGSFAGPVTYLPWYECVFPTGFEYARGVINEGFLN